MKESMNALVKTQKAPGAEYRKMPIPEIRVNEVLVKVEAAAICGSDLHIYNWNKFASERVKPPLIFGHEFFGEVVKIGSQVRGLKEGDKIAAETHLPCGQCFQCRTGLQHICQSWIAPGVHFDGGFAEFVSIPEILGVKLKSDTLPEKGALYEPFGVAVHAVLAGPVSGDTVIVFGCGPIGLFAIATARASGASKIFAIEISPYRLELGKKMGATFALNPKMENIEEIVTEKTDGVGADVIFEFSGSPLAAQQAFKILRKGGRIYLIGMQTEQISIDWLKDVIYKEAKIFGITGREMFKTWYQAQALLDSKSVDLAPVITHKFPLSEFKNAFEIANAGECGKVILFCGD